MNEKTKWDIEDSIFLLQFVLFYATVVGGIIAIVLAATKKISFPLLGVILIYVVAVSIQIIFLVIFSKSLPGDTTVAQDSAPTTSEEEEIEREIAEIKELKEHLRRDPKFHSR